MIGAGDPVWPVIGPFLSPCRLRRLQRQSRSQRRRRLRPSSIPPVHPFFFFLSPSVWPILPSLSLSLPLVPHSLSLFLFPFYPAGSEPQMDPSLHKPSPEEYFYQQFCKYWFRFLAQKRKREWRGFSDGVLLRVFPNTSVAQRRRFSFVLAFFFLLICFYFVLTDGPV